MGNSSEAKHVAYCATRNLYPDLIPAVKSLLKHSKGVRVHFLIEDDEFPWQMPKCVTAVNVRDQKWFKPSGPNYRRKWTWMVLMRMVFTKVLPDVDKVLSLDVDTIVTEDISGLWDIELGDNYVAACREPEKSENGLYVNMGVAMLNLKQLRDGKDDEIIHALNTRSYPFAEQDCVNELCKGRILELSSEYNSCDFTEKTNTPKIRHYAHVKDWQRLPLVQEYRVMKWNM